MTQATASHVAMLKGAIALAWADQRLETAEKTRILQFIRNNRQFSAEQKAELEAEVDHPHQLNAVWDQITDPQDRAHLITIAQLIFWEDGTFSHTEQEVYQQMESRHLATLDTAKLESGLQLMGEAAARKWEAEEKEFVGSISPMARFFYYLEKKISG